MTSSLHFMILSIHLQTINKQSAIISIHSTSIHSRHTHAQIACNLVTHSAIFFPTSTSRCNTMIAQTLRHNIELTKHNGFTFSLHSRFLWMPAYAHCPVQSTAHAIVGLATINIQRINRFISHTSLPHLEIQCHISRCTHI